MGLLTFAIVFPLISALIVLLLPSTYKSYFAWINVLTLVGLWINMYSVIDGFNSGLDSYQLVESVDWIQLSMSKKSMLDIKYLLGIDGVSLSMFLLTQIVFTIAAISSFSIKKREKAYFALILILLSAVNGCFLSLDFFLFFVFFEFMLLPMYFLIGIWGGANRSYASMKFLIYTLVGSVLILIGMLALSVSYSDDLYNGVFNKSVYKFDFRFFEDLGHLTKGGFLSINEPNTSLGFSARHVVFFFL
ncbi:MAG: proton-conducting transporter membrane subunit, partial [Leadbetterella sp.]